MDGTCPRISFVKTINLPRTFLAKYLLYFRGQTSREIAVVMLGHVVRLGLGVISSAFLARGLSPEGLSIFTVLGAWVMILGTFADFGLRNSAVRQISANLSEWKEKALKFAHHFGGLKMTIALGVVFGISLFAGPLSRLLKLPSEVGGALVLLGGFWVLATALSAVPTTILQALRQFPSLMRAQTLNIAVTVVLMGILFWGRWLTPISGLIVGIIAALGTSIFSYMVLPNEWRVALFRKEKLDGVYRKALWGFGKWVWVGTLFSIVYVQLDLLLLNHYAGKEETGFYALAFNLAQKSFILFQTLHMVMLPQASGLTHSQQIKPYLRRSMFYAFLMCGLIGLSMMIAKPAIYLIYGEVYAPSINLYWLLVIPVLLDLAVLPLFLLIYPLNLPRLEAFGNSLRVLLLLIFGFWLIPIFGSYGAGVAKIIATLLSSLGTGGLILYHLCRDRSFSSAREKPPPEQNFLT